MTSGFSPTVATTGIAILRLTGSTVEAVPAGDLPAHLVIRTPDNPEFWWGNYLQVLPGDDAPPARWLARFAEVFPQARHIAIGLPEEPDPAAWQATADALPGRPNLDSDAEDVLTLHGAAPRAVGLAEGYTVREVTTDAEWAALLANRVALNTRTGEHPHAEHLAFESAAVAAARSLVDAGHAAWFGAFTAAGELVAQMGMVDLGPGEDGHLARYQTVITEPEHRRRGLASHLLGVAADWARARGTDTLVICADADSDAGRIYRSLGFEATAVDPGVAGAWLRRPTASA